MQTNGRSTTATPLGEAMQDTLAQIVVMANDLARCLEHTSSPALVLARGFVGLERLRGELAHISQTMDDTVQL
jgi:hypothetical protein